jgi:hypothetical protein
MRRSSSDGANVSFHGLHGLVLIAQRLSQRVPVARDGSSCSLNFSQSLTHAAELLHAQLQLRFGLLHAVTRRVGARVGKILLECCGGGSVLCRL